MPSRAAPSAHMLDEPVTTGRLEGLLLHSAAQHSTAFTVGNHCVVHRSVWCLALQAQPARFVQCLTHTPSSVLCSVAASIASSRATGLRQAHLRTTFRNVDCRLVPVKQRSGPGARTSAWASRRT